MAENGAIAFRSLRIAFSDRIRGNFVRLPGSIVQVLENTAIPIQEFGIAVHLNGGVLHVGWDGFEASQSLSGQSCVQINPILAAAHKLREGDIVDLHIKQFDQSQIATEVYVEPQTSDDWEIMDGNARFLQDNILFQTRIVVQDELLICYVEQTIAKFKIQRIVAPLTGPARITTDTLVMVAPKVNRSRLVNGKSRKPVDPNPVQKPILLRTILRTKDLRGYSICVSPNASKSSMAMVCIVKNPLEKSLVETGLDEETKVEIAQNIAVSIITDPDLAVDQVMLSPLTWESLGFSSQNGYKLKVVFVADHSGEEAPTAFVYPVDQSKDTKRILINGKSSIAQYPAIQSMDSLMNGSVLTDRLYLPRDQVYIELISRKGEHIPFYRWQNEEIEFKFTDRPVKVLWTKNVTTRPVLPKCVGMEGLLEEMHHHLTFPLTWAGSSLITGTSGMGKSLLVNKLQSRLECGTPLHVEYVDCEEFMDNSNFVKMKQMLQRLMATCYWYGPSILILDNAEILFPQNKSDDEGQSPTNAAGVSTRLCQVLVQELEQLSVKNSGQVRVLLTAETRGKLNQELFSRHAIGKTWHLKPPGRELRSALMTQFLSIKSLHVSDDLDISTIATETNGYSPKDLLLLSETLLCEHLCDQEDSSTPVARETFERTIANFTPSSLRGIKLQKDTGVKWSSVGAMHQAKELLLETLEWPTKYEPIFSKSPLRLRSGILLYGYPGCGKTMLASAVAQQCGVNFISIKGPEILNKYIGASEQSVRECFERAQAARPCVLFFDEFDSIAPKRGHDSIGVTDRVVNQMLTQMDGAEGLEGVYVLAATSRPDLIDSALLRPGRLDKSVLCGLPTASERLQIIQAVVEAGSMVLESHCNLQEVADATEGMSGADLQGLCYTAYLKSAHRKMDLETQKKKMPDRDQDHDSGLDKADFEYFTTNVNETDDGESIERAKQHFAALRAAKYDASVLTSLSTSTSTTTATDPPKISAQDLKEACRETKPSISPTELQKLSQIYSLFSSNRDANMPSGEASSQVGGRLTLM
ncbi:LAME_0D04500g1_1 [Lachancea meyersii CBS 8951]|uniref:Peroxisomal ATPase PEX1 n=1 Tax=Lachancea meyersii CBS 8951 TaxID=1266667 RepID=A0A1G4J863_9SACH|nr:LAME_0D04500g1_1 [Lachancea meyersii CBS 8951]